MTADPWRIDRSLADDLAAALEWSGDDGAAELAARFPSTVLCGSTAKLAAVARGEVPPGADPDSLARTVLDDLAAGTSPSWSCWVVATLMAAVLDGGGSPMPRVAAARRVDPGAPIVDFHSIVVVDEGERTWLCDPYFGAAVPLPIDPGQPTEVDDGLRWARASLEPDGRWLLELHVKHWDDPLAFRLYAPTLDRGDVHALCAISVTHSGVPARPYARLHVGGRTVVDVHQDAAGATVLTSWPPTTRQTFAQWDQAVDAFEHLSGIRIV